MNDIHDSLIVEAHLDGSRIAGLLANVTQNRRLVDILNNQDSTFSLSTAEARLNGSQQNYRFTSVSIKKEDVLYAIPRETAEQIKRRAMFRTGMTTVASRPVALGVLLTHCHVAGTTLMPPGATHATIEPSELTRFFALTGALITFPDGTTNNEPVVVVNRDAVLAVGRTE